MTEYTLEQSKKDLQITANKEFKDEFTTILRARYPVFFLSTNEETRFIEFLTNYCIVNGYKGFIWDCYRGLIEIGTNEVTDGANGTLKDPITILEHIIKEGEPYINNKDMVETQKKEGIRGIIYVLLDYYRFIKEDPDVERRIKHISNMDGIITTVLTGPHYKSTDALENILPVIDFPSPNREEIKAILWRIVDGIKEIPGFEEVEKETKKMELDLINAVSGLTLGEAQTSFTKSIVCSSKWDINTILKEKRQIIRKSGLMDFYDTSISTKDVGGLKNLVGWIKDRKKCFSEEAEEYGLPKPRGILVLGFPGTGKSLVCKAVAGAWNMPLLRLDVGKLFDSFVGQSEARARSVLKTAESISPCILWLDEVEKALAGSASSGRSDSGITARVLSTFLIWMQEKTKPVFVVATANNHELIPPEFLRAGRFDEVFFVDLPNKTEREEIFEVLLKKNKYNPKKFNSKLLASKCDRYTGAEIEKAIGNAMLVGFSDKKRKITNNDIISAMKKFKPLYDMRKEEFAEMEEWAKENCVKANEEYVEKVKIGMSKNSFIDVEL